MSPRKRLLSPRKRATPQKKALSPQKKLATPQKRGSPQKKVHQSPAWKGKKQLIKRKIQRPTSRSLASAFGLSSPSLNSSTIASELFTESMPPPMAGSSNSRLSALDMDEEPGAVTIMNPFKSGSPVKKRRKTLDRCASQGGSNLPHDWDDETANDGIEASPTTSRRKSAAFPKHKTFNSVLDDYPIDFSSGLDSSFGSKGSPLIRQLEERISADIPIDNRLGTRLRITSPVPFSWMDDTKTGQYLVRITGKEQHEGTQMFIQSGLDCISKPCLVPPSSSSRGALLTAACSYFQYPVLPWLPLFPRISTQSKMLKDKHAPPLASSMLDNMNTEWNESLESVYLSWKKGDRHSFYVCCANVTAHFTRRREERTAHEESMSCFAASEDGLKHVVFLSPTTAGFRRYLREQGIQVETLDERGKRRMARMDSQRFPADDMDSSSRCSIGGDSSRLSFGSCGGGERDSFGPLNNSTTTPNASFQLGDDEKENSSREPSEMPSEANDAKTKGDENEDDDGGSDESGDNASPTKMGDAHDWLKGIGVSPASTLRMRRNIGMGRLNGGSMSSPNLSPSRRSTTRGGAGVMPKEQNGLCTVVIKDSSSVQSLYNLLLTSKSFRAIAGLHAALPPTLLAAQPFPKAQLQTLNKTSQILKRVGRPIEHVLELDGGPILPHTSAFAAAFARAYLVDNPTTAAPAHIRVNDRAGYPGLNALLEDGVAADWTEITVTAVDYRWKTDVLR